MPIKTFDLTLRAGWEPDTPATDSVLRRFLLNWKASIEAQGLPLGGRSLRRDDLAAVDLGRPSFGANLVTLLAPLFSEDVDEVMSALDEFYRFGTGGSRGSVYLFSPWPTPDLRLRGWALVDYQPLMLRPAGGAVPPPPQGLRIEEVRDEEGLRAFEATMVSGFELHELAGQAPGSLFSTQMLEDERHRLWIGWEGERPVSAAATFVAEGINDVTLVATVPEARQRGYGTALTWQATLAVPTLPSLLIATAEGRPVYERIGYISLFRFAVWSRNRLAASQ